MEENSLEGNDHSESNENNEENIDTVLQNHVDLVSPKTPRTGSEASFTLGGEKGWKLVKHNLHKILDYGRREGIIVQKVETEEEIKARKKIELKKLHDEEVKGSNKKEISFIHSAIPCLPVPVAFVCCVLNFILPGSGTLLSGICSVCMGQPRIQVKEGKVVMTVIINTLVAICQIGTITFMLVGWFWSMAWGGLLLMYSIQQRETKIKRRQVAVATAAIEALTSNALLHRRKVNSLIDEHNAVSNTNKQQERKNSAILNIMRSVSSQDHINGSDANVSENGLVIDNNHTVVITDQTIESLEEETKNERKPDDLDRSKGSLENEN